MEKKTIPSLRHQLHCNFTLNTEAFSESQFENLEHFQLTNTQVKSAVFDDFILRFSKLQSLNLDDNHIEMIKNVPGTVEKFSILHNPLNICTQETIMSIINMKRMIRSYRLRFLRMEQSKMNLQNHSRTSYILIANSACQSE